MLQRCIAAHLNGLETAPMWAAAILMAKVMKVKGADVRPLAVRYLAFRHLYNFLYVFGFNRFISYARTLVFFAAIGANLEVFGLALSAMP